MSVVWVITSDSISIQGRILGFCTIQTIFFIYTLTRPLELAKENLVEAINDFTYLSLTVILLFFNTKSGWTGLTANIAVGFVTGSTMFVGGIQMADSIKSLYQYIRRVFTREPPVRVDSNRVMDLNIPNKSRITSEITITKMKKIESLATQKKIALKFIVNNLALPYRMIIEKGNMLMNNFINK